MIRSAQAAAPRALLLPAASAEEHLDRAVVRRTASICAGRMRKAALLFGLALTSSTLGGCEALDRLDRERFQHACDNLGIARATPTYDQCMLQQQALDEEGSQRMMDRAAERQALERLRRH